jgi:hypothetical protein
MGEEYQGRLLIWKLLEHWRTALVDGSAESLPAVS